MQETTLLYDRYTWGDPIESHSLDFYTYIKRIEDNKVIHCYQRLESFSGGTYELLYFEINEDGYFIFERRTSVYYDIPHSIHGAEYRDVEPKYLTLWTKVKRYPNNLPQVIETSGNKREIHFRNKYGTLMQKTTIFNNNVSIVYLLSSETKVIEHRKNLQ